MVLALELLVKLSDALVDVALTATAPTAQDRHG